MKCYLEGRRREWVERRRAAVRKELNGAKPLLANRRGLAQREQFFALLRPLLAHLQPYIERELRLLNFQRRFPHQHWSSEEILDELLVRSWERIDSQGSDPKPDVWLMTILQEILGEMAFYPFRVAFESLLSHPTAAPEADAYDRFFLDHDLAVFADALSPDWKTPGWDVLHRKKQQRRLERALAGLPMQQRQAFVQHVLEGFTPVDIATIQSRDASEIVADVEAGKAAMKREVDEIAQTSHYLASLTQA
jgi:DNA-directed RNA polymerase specialized sigma24 family protein